MAKRRRCKDKLAHHEHEWNSDPSGMKSAIVLTGPGGRPRAVLQNYWCPGIKPAEKEQK